MPFIRRRFHNDVRLLPIAHRLKRSAVQIEKTYTKREILDIYLNYMNFGHGSYGVQSAANFYFGVRTELTVGVAERAARVLLE